MANGNGSGVEDRPLRLEQRESETVISDSSTVAVGLSTERLSMEAGLALFIGLVLITSQLEHR